MGNTLVMPVVVSGLSVGYACCPWVTPVGFTHGCVLATALRFLFCVGGWEIRELCQLSVGCASCPWVIRGLRLSASPTAVFPSPRCGFCFVWVDGESVGCAYRCPWVIRWLRLLSVGYAYRLHPRLCADHRAAVWVTHAD